MQIRNSVALITGANGGIGSQFVKQMLECEAQKVYTCGRSVAKIEKLVALASDRVFPIELDIVKPDSVAAAVRQCSDVSLLINNAGISLNQGLIAVETLEQARQEMEVNYFGMLSMCRAFSDVLKQRESSTIVNMCSLLGKVNLPFSGSYSASKAATISMTQGVRAELTEQGTLVVAVMPGTVDTELAKDWPDPKVDPAEVVRVALQAVIEEEEDVYPGEQATQISAQLLSDPKGVEKYLASFLPGMSLGGTSA